MRGHALDAAVTDDFASGNQLPRLAVGRTEIWYFKLGAKGERARRHTFKTAAGATATVAFTTSPLCGNALRSATGQPQTYKNLDVRLCKNRPANTNDMCDCHHCPHITISLRRKLRLHISLSRAGDSSGGYWSLRSRGFATIGLASVNVADYGGVCR